MKKIALISSSLLTLVSIVSCNNVQNKFEENDQRQVEDIVVEKPIGGDVDDHGCLTGAGQTWSELKQECIQAFNVGLRLNPIENNNDEAVISIFIIPADDKSKVEVIGLSSDINNTILTRTENNIYQNGIYKYDATDSTFHIDGNIKYSAER